jgi:hypothetical protein
MSSFVTVMLALSSKRWRCGSDYDGADDAVLLRLSNRAGRHAQQSMQDLGVVLTKRGGA